MSRKIYIGEDNLINLKNAMTGKNIGHSTFMQEDKPPYEKDEFTINPEGGANDNFHIGDDAINEHHLDQRLPFDDPYFSQKRYIEQYVDWLEEFGNYGELPAGTLDFWDEIKKAINIIKTEGKHGRFDKTFPFHQTEEEIFNYLKNEVIGPNIKFKDGKVVVEREIRISEDPSLYNQSMANHNDELYDKLIRNYNDNVGGCWSYCEGGAQSYCADDRDENWILLCGLIRTDDIDFVKVVQLNYSYPDEFEIRVKPFAKIELEKVIYSVNGQFGKSKTFSRHLIVSATYSGNNSKSNIFGYTKVDDGFGGIKYFDRNRREIAEDEFNQELMNRLANGEKPKNVFDYVEDLSNGFAIVSLNGKWNLINKKSQLIGDQWYDFVGSFKNDFASISLNNKWNFINQEGKPLSNQWFDYVDDFKEGFAVVELKGKYNLINQEGRLISGQWYDFVDSFNGGVAKVKLNNEWNFINREGSRMSDQWFERIDDFKEGAAKVKLNDKYNFISREGKLLSRRWFDWAYYFNNGFADVEFNGKNYKLYINGKLIPVSESKKNKKIILPENKLISIKENLENEVEANEVSLDSFKKQKELAPKIWNGDKLNSRVRLKLLDIADDFWETTDIGWVKPKGIVLMGSICNYNWSKSSDIDLHLQVDFSEVDEKKDFVQEYFNGKKNEWNEEHSNLKIFGFPVELYVEDIDADTNSGGIYDLEENDWIKKPSKEGIKQIGLDKYSIKDKSAKIMTDIDDLYDLFKKTDDDAKLRKIGEKAHDLLGKIKAMRKDGLSRGGESDKDNIVYKVLRRTGYMDILWNLSSQLYDKLNSIDEVNEQQAGLILEYLENGHNLPLYKYFKWAKTASDEEKALDLIYQCTDVAFKYLETRNANQCDELRNLSITIKKEGEDYVRDNEGLMNAFAKGIANNGLLRDFEFFMRYRGDFYDLPSWMTMNFNRIVKNEWCIHFCNDAYAIAREGFKWGTDDVGRLALTGAGMKKPSEGYNFAFPIGEYHIDKNSYGSFNPVTNERGTQEAVIFQASGIEVYHEGDEENQVIFWGPSAKNFIPIKYDRENGGWCIYGNKGQVLYSGKPSEILKWVLTNLPQYKKQIMVGKNGYELKEEVVADGNASHNPFRKRWKYERETLINYLTNYGEIMTSKENGKQYKVLFDEMLSSRIGINYCLCIQWNPLTMEPGNVIYVRALDKFTRRIFRPEFDTRGFDNIAGTSDDVKL